METGYQFMQYYSILFESAKTELIENQNGFPESFKDLNLDQIVQEIVKDREEYHLEAFFCHPLKELSAVNYRQEVMGDLEKPDLYRALVSFAYGMKKVREYTGFSRSLHHKAQREKWSLDASFQYCNTLLQLHNSLYSLSFTSKGLQLFSAWLTEYIHTCSFQTLLGETEELEQEFEKIKYAVVVDRDTVTVNQDKDSLDYSAELTETFKDFYETTPDTPITFFSDLEMCQLETKILGIVEKINASSFQKLESFAKKHAHYIHDTIERFDREIQFYLSYLEYIAPLKGKGYPFSLPKFSPAKNMHVSGGYDLALAYKSLNTGETIVPNDFYLEGTERIFILTGPNQGGKTTFARSFGQIFYLACLGCPVPCLSAELFLVDEVLTHFAREENLCLNAGRLQEDLFRMKGIIDHTTENSVVIINELFSSTTSLDAFAMGKRILEYFLSLDCIVLYVTHIYELSDINQKTVSLSASVDLSASKADRTYKILRKPADGCAYANSIAEKYHLTFEEIKERIRI
jgi:DNA mismatch repair ATPase MutS